MLQRIQKYIRRIHNLFITNQLSLQLEELSNCGNFTVITVLHNTDVLTWDYKNNNKFYFDYKYYFCNPMSIHYYYVKLQSQ